MGFWNRFLGRKDTGISTIMDPSKFMLEITMLTQDVEKALQKSDPRFKREVTARVDNMIELCQQFIQMGNATYAPLDNKNNSFVKVDISRQQQLVSSMLPLLASMKDKLNA